MQQPAQAIGELVVVTNALSSDVDVCLDALTTDDTQFLRRQLVRVIFAEIEGTCYRMKQLALSVHSHKRQLFSEGELALLREESYDLDEKGNLQIRPNNLPFASNFRFAVAAFARGLSKGYELRVGNHEWEALKSSARVRNRLMHPKTREDLHVSDEELEQARRAHLWFRQIVYDIIQREPGS